MGSPRRARPLYGTRAALALFTIAWLGTAGLATAQDDAQTRQLQLLCSQLSGDLSDPGGIAAFRRCLTTHNPLGEIRRDNNIGGGVPAIPDRAGARPPKGFGRDSRRSLADGVQRFATRDGSLFYAIDRDSKLWRWNAVTKDAKVIDKAVAAFEPAENGQVLVLGRDARLWRLTGEPMVPAPIDEQVGDFQSIGATVFVRGIDGKLWRENGTAGNRTLVDQQVTSFQAIDAGLVYVLGRDSKLWRENGDASERTEVASKVIAFQYVPDGDVTYVLAQDGTLWRQQGSKAEQVDRDVAAFQALDTRLVFVLGRDGRLWRAFGTRDRAVLVNSDVLTTNGRVAFQATDAQHVYVLGKDRKLWAETMPAAR